MSLCCADKARITNMHGTNEKKNKAHEQNIGGSFNFITMHQEQIDIIALPLLL